MPPNISNFGQLPDEAEISFKVFAAVCGVSISTMWRYYATDPTFPKVKRLTKRCTRIRAGDARAWLGSKGAA